MNSLNDLPKFGIKAARSHDPKPGHPPQRSSGNTYSTPESIGETTAMTAERLNAKTLAVRKVIGTLFREFRPTNLIVTERIDCGDPILTIEPEEVVANENLAPSLELPI
jgi:hypothetical protein